MRTATTTATTMTTSKDFAMRMSGGQVWETQLDNTSRKKYREEKIK
jgi:hypothetical protein